jgi:hypothetical protein
MVSVWEFQTQQGDPLGSATVPERPGQDRHHDYHWDVCSEFQEAVEVAAVDLSDEEEHTRKRVGAGRTENKVDFLSTESSSCRSLSAILWNASTKTRNPDPRFAQIARPANVLATTCPALDAVASSELWLTVGP